MFKWNRNGYKKVIKDNFELAAKMLQIKLNIRHFPPVLNI